MISACQKENKKISVENNLIIDKKSKNNGNLNIKNLGTDISKIIELISNALLDQEFLSLLFLFILALRILNLKELL